MNRCLAFFLALIFASLSVASACTAAAPGEWVSFTLQPARDGGEIKATFRDESRRPGDSNWSSSFRPSQLAGFDLSGFRLQHPALNFAVSARRAVDAPARWAIPRREIAVHSRRGFRRLSRPREGARRTSNVRADGPRRAPRIIEASTRSATDRRSMT